MSIPSKKKVDKKEEMYFSQKSVTFNGITKKYFMNIKYIILTISNKNTPKMFNA